jgi:hypothetical protein
MTLLKSRRINKWVLHLLLICRGVFCAVQGISQTTQNAEDEEAFKGIVEVNGRLQILPLIQPLKVGEENEIPIQLHGYKVHYAYVSWGYYQDGGTSWVRDGGNAATILRHEDGSTYVQIVPDKIGKLRLQVGAWFEGGGDEDGWIDAEVVFPDRKPEKFYIGDDLKASGTINLGLSNMSSSKATLDAKALYKDAVHPTPIPLKYLSFRLITATESDPPISLDESTGLITALHIGHALIMTTFQGMSTLTCVDVMKYDNDGSDPTVCKELVPEGMSPPLTGYEGLAERVKAWNEERDREQPKQ